VGVGGVAVDGAVALLVAGGGPRLRVLSGGGVGLGGQAQGGRAAQQTQGALRACKHGVCQCWYSQAWEVEVLHFQLKSTRERTLAWQWCFGRRK